MNKKLIALAIAGACIAPEAIAQTANPVTLYGRAFATVESIKDASSSNSGSFTRIADQASLLGVRGTEDLGGGLKVFFQLETAFAIDVQQTTFATRNSGVGLQGGWGSIVIGRWDMPFKLATIAVDPFGDLTISGITGANNDQGNFDRRDSNVAQYWSPNFGGFAFRLAKTTEEGAAASGAAASQEDMGASITYSRGPIYVFYAYEKHESVSTSYEEEGNAVGGSFRFGAFKIGGLYEQIEKSGLTKKKTWLANVTWTAGKNQVMYQYQNAQDGAASGASQPECDSHSVGYQYNFSRRTYFIASYTKVENDVGTACNFGAGRQTLANGQDPEGFSVGLRHVF